MAQKAKIVGYGICGPHEKRLENTLKEFKRLCDETIILCNNTDEESVKLIESYGFKTVEDNREWGKLQWKIKEDFVTNHVSKLNPDMCVCLDMDEVFDTHLTKEGLYELYNSPFQSFYFYIVNLWDDGYQKELCFWNIRAFKWNGKTTFPRKNLHCGLAPEWVWYRGFYAPYILKHYGLKDADKRAQKVIRYKKYDPAAKWLSLQEGYYKTLASSPQVTPFNEDKLHQDVVDYVHTYKQTYREQNMKEEKVVYIRTLAGEVAPVPAKDLDKYLKQGCEHVTENDDLNETLDKVLAEEPVEEVGGEIFQCNDCQKQFDSGKKLNAHKIGAHKKSFKWGK